jgi:hypothetical protein
MSRKYRESNNPKLEIITDVALRGKSEGWSGSLEELELLKAELAKFNIFYICDFRGAWKNVVTKKS